MSEVKSQDPFSSEPSEWEPIPTDRRFMEAHIAGQSREATENADIVPLRDHQIDSHTIAREVNNAWLYKDATLTRQLCNMEKQGKGHEAYQLLQYLEHAKQNGRDMRVAVSEVITFIYTHFPNAL